LHADGITQWVNPVVVWGNPISPLKVENPAVAVWSLARLPEELGNIPLQRKISEVEHHKIVEKLTKLCEHRRLVLDVTPQDA